MELIIAAAIDFLSTSDSAWQACCLILHGFPGGCGKVIMCSEPRRILIRHASQKASCHRCIYRCLRAYQAGWCHLAASLSGPSRRQQILWAARRRRASATEAHALRVSALRSLWRHVEMPLHRRDELTESQSQHLEEDRHLESLRYPPSHRTRLTMD